METQMDKSDVSRWVPQLKTITMQIFVKYGPCGAKLSVQAWAVVRYPNLDLSHKLVVFIPEIICNISTFLALLWVVRGRVGWVEMTFSHLCLPDTYKEAVIL